MTHDDDDDAVVCRECGAEFPEAGDGWDGMCPGCADKADPEEPEDPKDTRPPKKLVATIRDTKTGREWQEKWDAEHKDPRDVDRRRPAYPMVIIRTQAEADLHCRAVVAAFNNRLRPGETPREFVSCRLVRK